MKLSQIKNYLRRPFLIEDIHTAMDVNPTARPILRRLEKAVDKARRLYGYAEHCPLGWDVSFVGGRFVPSDVNN